MVLLLLQLQLLLLLRPAECASMAPRSTLLKKLRTVAFPFSHRHQNAAPCPHRGSLDRELASAILSSLYPRLAQMGVPSSKT